MRGTKLTIADLQQPEERENGSKKISDGGLRRIIDDLRGGGDDRGQTAWAVAVLAVSRGISRYRSVYFEASVVVEGRRSMVIRR